MDENKEQAEKITGRRLLTDTASGKELWALVAVERRDKTNLKGYLTMFQPALEYIAQNPLSANEQRVFWTACAQLDLQNFIRLTITDIAHDVQIDRADASRAMKSLIERGLIEEGPKLSNNSRTYKLNANVGWRGKHSQAKKAQAASNVINAESRFKGEIKSTFEQAATLYAAGATIEEAASYINSDELRDVAIDALEDVKSGKSKKKIQRIDDVTQ